MNKTVATPVNPPAELSAVDPDQPVPFVLTPAAEQPAARTATVRVQGVAIEMPCPEWCVIDHANEPVNHFADVYHTSEQITVTAPYGIQGRTEDVLQAFITCYPFCEESAPYLALDASGNADGAELSAVEATAFADQLVAHAARLRRMARTLSAVEGSVSA